ncbi:MAG: hypothetical protein ACKO2G_00095 [Verrucomicrobiales bacterium]
MFSKRLSAMASLVFATAALPLSAQSVHVSRMWHNHQPLYWPEWNTNGSQTKRIEFARDSMALKFARSYAGSASNHPENDVTNIFGNDDRRAAYQDRPRASLAHGDMPAGSGFCVSFSGSLMDSVRSYGANNENGYGPGWWDGNRTARNWTTPGGSRRMDLVGFTYHHSLAPLLPEAVFRKEIQIFKQAWWKAWGGNSNLSDHSKGFFPTEMAFSRHMIDVLADEGYQWAIVPSHHLSRTCPTYFDRFNLATGNYGIFSSPPNRADLLGPSPTNGWWYAQPNPGNAAWNVAPFAYQLHRARTVDPTTGAAKEIILVPSDDVLSYRYGYSDEGISKINTHIAPYSDPARPSLVMPSTDGDNAWGGGFDSWMVATPKFFKDSANAGYKPTAVQDMVDDHAPPSGQYVHIEDGAWIFPESCYGSPNFLKWIEPPVAATATARYPGTVVDMETPGFALKFWAWAPVITGANWVETAEQILRDEGGDVQSWKIQAPYDWNGADTGANDVELAWHIYLGGLDSGFNYYGGLGNDDEVKAALATTRTMQKLQPWMTPGRRANDRTAPSVLKPQRFPYNPGGYTFGWFNSVPGGDTRYLKRMPTDFYVWTHAYDLSGVTNMTLKVRFDSDGVNTMGNDQNETYAGGSDVGGWMSLAMTKRVLPNSQAALNAAANNSQINYFITPPELADYYFAKINESTLPGFEGKLLDYYIESVDGRGNVHKTEIQHVFVEDGDGIVDPPLPGEVVSISPGQPADNAPITITYDPTGRNLSSASQVYIHLGRNGWQNVITPRPAMTKVGNKWQYTLAAWPGTTMLDMAFTSASGSGGTWDNNGSQDWHFSVTSSGSPPPPATPTGLTVSAVSTTSISLDWPDVANATSYVVFRGATELGTTMVSNWTDNGLAPSSTHSYTVKARNAGGDSAASAPASATTLSGSGGGSASLPFTMDGQPDHPGYLLSNPGMVIHAAVRGGKLYVCTWAPGGFGNDHFVMIGNAALSSPTTPAPWVKSGSLAVPNNQPYLAAESANSFIGWFNSGSAATTLARGSPSQHMEGTIDLSVFPALPNTLYLTALAYQSADAGLLGAQAPATVVAGNDVEASELFAIPLEVLRDEDANGIYDRLEPGVGFVVTEFNRVANSLNLDWAAFPGRTYRVEASTTLLANSWQTVPGSQVTAGPTETSLGISLEIPPGDLRRFFRVALDP